MNPPIDSSSITIWGNVNIPVMRRQLGATVRVACQIDLFVLDATRASSALALVHNEQYSVV